MDGVIKVRQPLNDFFDEQQPRNPFRCHWVRDVLALGLIMFPVRIYEKMRQLRDGTSTGSRNQ